MEYKLRLKVPTTVRFQQLVGNHCFADNPSFPNSATAQIRSHPLKVQRFAVGCRHRRALLRGYFVHHIGHTLCWRLYAVTLSSDETPDPPQVTQLKYRLSEGNGECFYYIGAAAAPVAP